MKLSRPPTPTPDPAQPHIKSFPAIGRTWLGRCKIGLAVVLFGAAVPCQAQKQKSEKEKQMEPESRTGGPVFQTDVTTEQLDPEAFSEWVDGKESRLEKPPQTVVWTTTTPIRYNGVDYGESRSMATRHLRIGFREAIPVGSVMVGGGGSLSVLKPDAPYPGNPADESQWTPAVRVRVESPTNPMEETPIPVRTNQMPESGASTAEVVRDDYGLWTLPPGTRTRALRFSHTPRPGDKTSAGFLGGAWILKDRLGNAAPQGQVASRARADFSARLVDESNDGIWDAWDNGENGAAQPISESNPETFTIHWNRAVELRGLCLLWTGFRSVTVSTFTGKADADFRNAPESEWQPIKSADGLDPLYPLALGPQWLPFDTAVTTRAIRLRITGCIVPKHSHLDGKVKDGRRVWLGECMALTPLRDAAVGSIIQPKAEEEPPPIPIHFTLPEAGLVTLVIEDQNHQRVRNLVSETPFPAGANTAWWDGSDDLLRDPDAASHGVYHIPSRPVAPANYQVRGLWHRPFDLRYEFSVYNAGKPPWTTADKTGGWLTTHTPPTSIAFVPGSSVADGTPLVLMGAAVAEGGHGLQWLREDGTKLGGQTWVGGNWTGAPTLAVDSGPQALEGNSCYVGSVWEGELRLTAKTPSLEDKPVLKVQLGKDPRREDEDDGIKTPPVLPGFDGGARVYVLSGIAAWNGTVVCSMVRQNELFIVDAAAGKITGRIPVENPRGLCFDSTGRLLALSGGKLLRFENLSGTTEPELVIQTGLEDPRHIVSDASGNFLITDRGTSHQVKKFSPAGQWIMNIGHPGAPANGLYDPLHLNSPNGLAIDSQNRIWVAEADDFPRRVSVWNADGTLLRAFYGPTEYGGGGVLDPVDPKRFFYKGMEFALDWKTGTDQLVRVFSRPDPNLSKRSSHYSPDTPLYPDGAGGKRYFTSCYTHNPTGGDDAAFLWTDDGPQARLVAGLGDAEAWPLLRTPEFASAWPDGGPPAKRSRDPDKAISFSWSDRNGDGAPQADEMVLTKSSIRGVTVMNDLSFVVARCNGMAARFAPVRLDGNTAPSYDLTNPERLGPAGGNPPSSGGDQALHHDSGWTVTTNAPAPFSASGIGGSLLGETRWSYPSVWPGLHASHEAAVPDRPGMVVGHTRLAGGFIDSKCGPLFCLNGNMGNLYLFSADGLFVATLFHDARVRPKWAAPAAVRNMEVTQVSLHDENFWPSITQTPDSKVFLVDGGRTSLVRIDGMETLARLPDQTLTVTPSHLEKARAWTERTEIARQKSEGSGIMSVPLSKDIPTVDGDLSDWPGNTDWAFIDRRGTKANFNSDSKPYQVTGAVRLGGGKLFAAWRTTEKNLLNNSGETPDALLKTGGCLDLMLQTDTDQRLLITVVKGQPRAVLYRQKVPGTETPVSFSSPWRSIKIDSVVDVTDKLSFAGDGTGNFEISFPLADLHWTPAAGASVKADIGVLRGNAFQTTQRVYWSNKATAITADVPSEAELAPRFWGTWKVVSL